MKRIVATILITAIGGTAFAHGKATGIVRERMDGMVVLAKTMKSLVEMSKPTGEFDTDLVTQNADKLIGHAGENITSLFPAGSTKHSMATPLVWSESAEFAQLAEDLATAAQTLNGVTDKAALKLSIKAIGKSCSACHADYRQKTE